MAAEAAADAARCRAERLASVVDIENEEPIDFDATHNGGAVLAATYNVEDAGNTPANALKNADDIDAFEQQMPFINIEIADDQSDETYHPSSSTSSSSNETTTTSRNRPAGTTNGIACPR